MLRTFRKGIAIIRTLVSVVKELELTANEERTVIKLRGVSCVLQGGSLFIFTDKNICLESGLDSSVSVNSYTSAFHQMLCLYEFIDYLDRNHGRRRLESHECTRIGS